MSARVIIIGDAMLDVVVRPTETIASTSDTPSSVRISRGGSAANIAVAIGRELDVTYVGIVGDDSSGEIFRLDLEENGVTPNLSVVSGDTGVVVAVVAGDGQRAMMTDRGVNSQLAMGSVLAALKSNFDHLHVSGYTVLDDATRDIATAALDVARDRGATTSVDVCSVGPLSKLGAENFLGAIGEVSMLFANEEEALALSGKPDVLTAGHALGDIATEVMITRGELGAIVIHATTVLAEPSRHVKVVDTTGAGDAASGAYLTARLNGLDCVEALRLAMKSASQVVGGLGVRG